MAGLFWIMGFLLCESAFPFTLVRSAPRKGIDCVRLELLCGLTAFYRMDILRIYFRMRACVERHMLSFWDKRGWTSDKYNDIIIVISISDDWEERA